MISTDLKNKILNAMTGQASSVSIASYCYLGLIQSIEEDSTGKITFKEANSTYTDETSGTSVSTGYSRTLIGYNGQSKTYKMNSASGGKTTNKDAVYTCECLDQHETVSTYPAKPWGECPYFGLFSTDTLGASYTPFAWGKILSEDGKTAISIDPGWKEIPVIRVGQLKLTIEDSED